MLVARLTEMHLRVDHAGKTCRPLASKISSRLGIGEAANGHDAPCPHADIGSGNAIRRGADAAADQKIERLRH